MYGTHQSLAAVHTILRKNDDLWVVDMKLEHRRKYCKGQAALRIYANQPVGPYSVIVKTDGSFAALLVSPASSLRPH